MKTKQLDLWRSKFGADYAGRGNNQLSEKWLGRLKRDWGRMLQHVDSPKPKSALEVGCNIGNNLIALRNLVPELHGIEPNSEVVRAARENPLLGGITIQEGDAFELPYPDSSIDLVFTYGVLIHIAPQDLPRAVNEMCRVARHYVLCNEYFSHEPVAIPYRGMEGYLFKRDFGRFFLECQPSLRVLDYGFLWKLFDSGDDTNWWLFAKS